MIPRTKRFQFGLVSLFEFLFFAAIVFAVTRIFVGFVQLAGLYNALGCTALLAWVLSPFVLLYRWWIADDIL